MFDLNFTLLIGAIALLLLIIAAFANRRRGIGRWSLVPWDYLLIAAAAVLLACAAHLAILWRDGRI